MIELGLSCVCCNKVILSLKRQTKELEERCQSCYRKAAVKAQNDTCFFCESRETTNWYHVTSEKRIAWTRRFSQDETEKSILNTLGVLEPFLENENWSSLENFSHKKEKIRLVQCVRCYAAMKPR